jgi:cellulose synthase/poly-beta-1,6-N-acetylglucosamine synthase-like glycosyltransferase
MITDQVLDSTSRSSLELQAWRQRLSAWGEVALTRRRRSERRDPRAAQLPAPPPGARRGTHPTVLELDPMTAEYCTYEACEGLLVLAPELSAGRRAVPWARPLLLTVVLAFLGAAVAWPRPALVTGTALSICIYSAALVYRSWLFMHSFDAGSVESISDAEALALPEAALPTYTVMVPAYREPTIIAELVRRLELLDYPHAKLDVQLLLEDDDLPTIAAALEIVTELPVQIILVPASMPRTKPKACNFGLQLARGDYIVIFDAEDRPEPLQLRRAVAAFSRLGPEVACLQARLDYYNGRQNIITRWFEAEYLVWFRHMLPGVVATGGTVPLGGTSNHLRRSALEVAGGWDAHNVTEDADLGIRLARLGYRVGVLDSVTEEEANSDFVNWAKQRSRWYKGYLQTALVHLRHPRALHQQLGTRGLLGFVMLVAGTPLLALLNPVFWTLSLLYLLTASEEIAALFPPAVYYAALLCWLLGNSSIVYASLLTARLADRPHLVLAALLSPLYWVMMSVAAVKAVVQLVQDPSYWEKTTHGLLARHVHVEQDHAAA